MIRINCPFCGERDHAEFTYGGDGSIEYPALDADAEAWREAVFARENIRGVQLETWHHAHGCRAWLVVERDTLSHEIHAVRAAHEGIAAALENRAADNTINKTADNTADKIMNKTANKTANKP